MFLKCVIFLTLTTIQTISAADSPVLLSTSAASRELSQEMILLCTIESLVSGTIKPLTTSEHMKLSFGSKRIAVSLSSIQSLLSDAQKEIDVINQSAGSPELIESNFFAKFPIKSKSKDSDECKKHFALFALHSFISNPPSPHLKTLYYGLIEGKKTFSEIVALHESITPIKLDSFEERYKVFADRYWTEFSNLKPRAIQPNADATTRQQPEVVYSSFPCCNTL